MILYIAAALVVLPLLAVAIGKAMSLNTRLDERERRSAR